VVGRHRRTESVRLMMPKGADIEATRFQTLGITAAPRVLDFVGFSLGVSLPPTTNSLRMLDSCWISRRAEHLFASPKTSKACLDLLVRVVGGDGFEPPTPAL
jgi:hypothetical protein